MKRERQKSPRFVDRQGVIYKGKKCKSLRFNNDLPGIKIQMIRIPEGQFWMGSPKDEKGRYDDESPQHKVTVSSFFMSETPITEGQWRFIANLPQEQMQLNPNPSSDGDEYPVRGVSWKESLEFCARLSRYTKRNYRLPSEAEWEYACRSVIGQEWTQSEWNEKYNQPFHFGETITSKLANYNCSVVYQQEPKGVYRRKPTPVRTFPPNAFGLYDMHGNVWEWCLDPWHNNYKGAPNDGRVWDEGKEDLYQDILKNLDVLLGVDVTDRWHVLRGGPWVGTPRICRSASRLNGAFPTSITGFRVVCLFDTTCFDIP